MSAPRPDVSIRDYEDPDAASWLRCRALSFLGTSYYDDVAPVRTELEGEAIRLVAVRPRPEGVRTPGRDEVVGILDVELAGADGSAGPSATIDTVAVHPDHQRQGIADALLELAVDRLRERRVGTLDAWTREDPAANAWYLRHGFEERQRYVHVHKTWQDPADGWTSPDGLSAPVLAFAHGRIEDLAELRRRYRRVHVCRQYVRRLT